MAITSKNDTDKFDSAKPLDPAKRFDRRYRVAGGLFSAVLSLVACGGIVVHLFYKGLQNLPAEAVGLHVVWIVAFGVLALLGLCVVAGRKQAFWITLAFWLVVTGGLVAQAFGGLLWGGKSILPCDQPIWATVILVGGIAAGGIVVALQVLATAVGSRNRYGAMVGVSVAVAVTVVLVMNMIAARHPYRRNFETLGRYGLSERTRRILEKIDKPIRLSAIYAAAKSQADTEPARKKRRETQQKLRRVIELFDEMQNANPNIIAVDASGDAARSVLLSRLRQRLRAATWRQEALLKKIQALLPGLEKQLAAERVFWAKMPADSYLGLWGLDASVSDALDKSARQLDSAGRGVAQEQASSPLPNYIRLLANLVAELKNIRKALDTHAATIGRLAQLPAKVKANTPKLTAAMDKCAQAIAEIETIVGQPGSALPDTKNKKTAETLKKLAVALGRAGSLARQVAVMLDTIAGSDREDLRLVSLCRAWLVEVPSRFGQIRTTRSRLLDAFAQQLESLRAQVALQVSDANIPAQQRFIKDMRKVAFQLGRVMKNNQTAVAKGIAQMQTVDEFSKSLFVRAGRGEVFGDIRKRIDPLTAQASEIKPPVKPPLPPDLSGENIIVVEAAGKVEVVGFEQVWPDEMKADFFLHDGARPRRFFNGDAALATRILALTQARPFARVLITYYQPPLPPGVDPRRFRPPAGPIPRGHLQILSDRLRAANFKVEYWNLTDPLPGEGKAATQPTSPADTLPTVLLLLPPAKPVMMPGGRFPDTRFGQKQLAKVRKTIDGGASAVFLAKTLMPTQSMLGPLAGKYNYNKYLRKDWGIDVHAGAMLIDGIASEEAGKYRLNVSKLAYLPLNNFTDNIIGRSLRGRRLAWLQVCPITFELRANRPAGVDVQPVLLVPETMTNIWATGDLQALAAEVHLAGGNLISPHYDKGDMKVPLIVAVAATRLGEKSKHISPSRIVVLGLAGGLQDWYLSSPIRSVEEGFRTSAPPRDNAELVVNSVYWLTGRERFIAAGPLRIKPVEAMSQTTQTLLWSACVIALPATVLIIGGVVLLIRRR